MASPTSEDDDGWTDLRADVVDSYMAEAALSEKFEGISGAGSRGSSSGSGPGARGGGGSARPPSYPGMPLSGGPDAGTRSDEEGRQVIIPLDASDSYDDCKDRLHEKMSAEIAEIKAELEAKKAELEDERRARAALEKRCEQAEVGSSRSLESEAVAAQLQSKLDASMKETASLRAELGAAASRAADADATAKSQRVAAAATRNELAQTTERFNSAMAEVVTLTSEITLLRKEQEDRSLVSHLEAHTRHEEEIQRELQRLGHAHEQELRRLEEAYAHVHSALTQQSVGASEQPDLLATDDVLFGVPAGEDAIPRATRLTQRLAELPSLFDALRARECRKIALQGFALGELALFFPVPSKNATNLPQPPSDGGAPLIHQNYLAFNVLPKQPRYYIADESMALIGRKGVRHFNRKYVLGMIIEKTLHKADATSAARYDIPVGTSFYTLLVNEVDYWS